MHHPLQSIPPSRRKALFWGMLVATLLWMALMQVVSAPLITPDAPQGIVSFELAGSLGKAKWILASWDAHARLYAAFGLGIDYIFMLLYSTTIGLACLWAGDVLHAMRWPLSGLGVGLAWGQWLAAALDALENVALAILLLQGLAHGWPELARLCAVLKFALIISGLVYAFGGLAAYLFQRLKRFRRDLSP